VSFLTAKPFLPDTCSLPDLRKAAKRCEGCDLYLAATQTVFGEGEPGSALMLVGEQPGDQEDRAGHVFVGPAGRVLDQALQWASIDRSAVYLTNAVKHFKHQERGKRRLHKRPTAAEADACYPWLESEIDAVQPRVVVCLGAVAVRSVLGTTVPLHRLRGRLHPLGERVAVATFHPSAVLRAPDATARELVMGQLVEDLQVAARAADGDRIPTAER